MKKAAFLFFRVEVGNAACAVQYLVVVQTMLVRCPKNLDFTVFQKVSLSNLIFLLTGVYMLYYPNFTSLTTMIRDGKLDMYLVKPVAAQFLVTMQRLDLSLLVPDAAAGIIMIGIGWHRAGLPVTVGSIAGFGFFLICGALLTYSLFLLPHLLVFWTTATNGIADLTAAVWDFNNMPQLIYGKWMQRIGTFLLPVFVITNFPGLFLMGELSVPMAVWGVAAPIVFFLIARAVWNQAVKNYTSAST